MQTDILLELPAESVQPPDADTPPPGGSLNGSLFSVLKIRNARLFWIGESISMLGDQFYLIALPFVLFAGAGFLIFFVATAWLLGREYFELAAMRFRSPAEAKAMRKDNAATVFTAGLFIAAFVSIPIVNLATPLFGMAFMVHMHKRLSGPRPQLMEPARKMPVA